MKKVQKGAFVSARVGTSFCSVLGSMLIAVTASILFMACGGQQGDPNAIVKLYGNGNVSNFSKDFLLYRTRCQMGQPGALRAETGDMFLLENWLFLNEPSIKDHNGSIHFIQSDSILILNGKTAGILVDSTHRIGELIDLADKAAVAELKVLQINQAGIDQDKKGLAQIAAANPKVMLSVSDNIDDETLQWLLDLFSPTAMMIALSEQQQRFLSSEQQLTTLFIINNDSVYHCTPLPALSQLRHLYFTHDENKIVPSSENKNWLKNNPQIRSLMLTDWEENYPKGLLASLTAPEVLIMGGMNIPAAEILAHRATLKRVIIDSGALQLELPGVNDLFLFSTDNIQSFIDTLGKKKADCIALGLFATNESADLTPLLQLKKLEALTLIDADSIALAPLKEMQQLKLLSYGTDSTNMDSTITVLKAALPNTLVVANDGLCLGSGWLMALVPALLAAMGLAAYKRKKQATES